MNSGSSAGEIGAFQVARLEQEVLDHHAVLERGERVVVLLQHPEAEVLEHRQDVRDRDQAARAQDAQVHVIGRCAGVRAQIQLRHGGLGRQRLEVGDVVERLRRFDLGAIARREHARVAAGELDGIARDAARDQCLLQAVFPRGRGGRDFFFHRGDVVHRARALRRAHQQVQAREVRIRDLHLRFHVRAAEALAHDAFDALAHLGVVAIARHVDQAGIEAPVGVAAREQAHASAFVEIDDAAHAGDQLRGRHLEQFVAREVLDDVHHGLGVVALRRQVEVLDHRVELAPQQRNFRGR